MGTQTNPATCWWWQRNDGEPRASTSVLSGPSIPVPADQAGKVVPMVKADKSGWQADRVFFGPDYANYVISTGNDPAAATQKRCGGFRVRVRFGVERNQETLGALGLSTPPKPAPCRCCGCWRRGRRCRRRTPWCATTRCRSMSMWGIGATEMSKLGFPRSTLVPPPAEIKPEPVALPTPLKCHRQKVSRCGW